MAAGVCRVAALRRALNYLYDPGVLAKSPLLEQLAESGQPRSAAALRKTLERAIESLKPESDVPLQSYLWRIYEVLRYRYIEQCSQQEVADQLGLSLRQLKREQHKALHLLAQRLNEQCGWNLALEDADDEDDAPDEGGDSASVSDELSWLTERPAAEPLALQAVLPGVLALLQGMAAQHNVQMHVEACDACLLAVHAVALRQILLSVLNVAIRHAAGGCVHLSTAPHARGVQITVQSQSHGPYQRQPDDIASLNVAQELVKASGGALRVEDGNIFCARILLPAAEQWPILVIDDNIDALRLLERYVLGTRYRLVGLQDPQQATAIAAQVTPRAIVLDVMMPEIDGWELLGRIRQHPLTAHIPVIACTILAQEELARSLGVSEFLRKPISREAFLAALERLLAT